MTGATSTLRTDRALGLPLYGSPNPQLTGD